MPNVFVTVPWPDTNGTAGDDVNVSTLAREKTLYLPDDFRGKIDLEVMDSDASGAWVPVRANIVQGATRTPPLSFVGQLLRIRRHGHTSGGTVIRVGAEEVATVNAAFDVPANNGVGATLDTSAMGPKKTIKAGGTVKGQYYVEAVSGGVVEGLAVINGPGILNIDGVFEGMRIRRAGKVDNSTANITIAAETGAAAGGSGNLNPTGFEVVGNPSADSGAPTALDLTKGHSFITRGGGAGFVQLPDGTSVGLKHTVSAASHPAGSPGNLRITATTGGKFRHVGGAGGSDRVFINGAEGGFVEFEWSGTYWQVTKGGTFGATGLLIFTS